jgi:lipopolysaccharide transport system permease protein
MSQGVFQPNGRLIYLRDLLRELVLRDMKLRYKGSVLGLAWSLLNPLAQLLVFGLVFSTILPLNIPNYTAFLFTGLLVWSWFQSSLFAATTVIVDGRSLIKRPGFPVALLPVVTVTANLVHFALALPVLLLFLLLTGIALQATVLLLPLLIAIQFLLTLSFAYFLAAIHVTFRDTQHLVGVVLLLFFYLTPIFYDGSAVPAAFQPVYRLNPLLHLLEAYRAILIEGRLPDFGMLAVVTAVSAVLLLLGFRVFRRASYTFVEEL